MSIRQVVLDTETTGLRVEDGHRIIEIGCVELIDRKLTGRHLHHYINPEREVEAGALAVHGITNAFLQDKPTFTTIVEPLIAFIQDAELIIHNAPFDLAFLNSELTLTKQPWKPIADYCAILDTLVLARQIHVGQRNSLDALCKRYNIDNTKRDLHGALLDANLLAQVYLAMTGGQGNFFDHLSEEESATARTAGRKSAASKITKHQLSVLFATAEELAAHAAYMEKLK